MKKFMMLLSVAIFIIAVSAYAAEDKKQELRPVQKIMQARAASLTAMNKNLEAKNFKAIIKDADEMAARDRSRRPKNWTIHLAKKITIGFSRAGERTIKSGCQRRCANCKNKAG